MIAVVPNPTRASRVGLRPTTCMHAMPVTVCMYNPSSPVERVEAHLKYLAELVPGWLTVLTVNKNRYIKLNKKTDIKHTLKTIALAESTLKL